MITVEVTKFYSPRYGCAEAWAFYVKREDKLLLVSPAIYETDYAAYAAGIDEVVVLSRALERYNLRHTRKAA